MLSVANENERNGGNLSPSINGKEKEEKGRKKKWSEGFGQKAGADK